MYGIMTIDTVAIGDGVEHSVLGCGVVKTVTFDIKHIRIDVFFTDINDVKQLKFKRNANSNVTVRIIK
jgi:hypothetical protein